MFLKSVVLILFLLVNFGFTSDFTLKKQLDIKADFITTDQIGNLYCFCGPELTKIDLKNNKQLKYSNSLAGNITSIDSSDPFRILLFYKDFNKIVFLDKNLVQITSPVSLDDIGYYHVTGVCQSINGGFWLFDQSLCQLVYIDRTLSVVKKSAQFPELISQNNEQERVFLIEKNDYIYLGTKNDGILLFDQYGTYIKTFPIKNVNTFQVINDQIIYLNNGNLALYDVNNYNKKIKELPLKDAEQVIIGNDQIFLKEKNKITIYQMNNF